MDKGFIKTIDVKPSKRQIEWQKTEFYALISYGMPVFTGVQYGEGFTPPSVFCPEDMDTDSWCADAKAAGMKGLVLTCKHYDGFCLWPTAYTDYSVKNSNWLGGKGDLVKMTADSCRKYGLKFGIYITPWDRHEKTYGSGKAYDDFFCGLLKELLTSYGDIFCVWLDGVCGENETRMQNHDWGRYYALIRELAPDAVISFRGPDVRWCGNEKGVTRQSEWSVVPAHVGVYEDGSEAKSKSRKASNVMELDIGGRKTIKNETEFIWYPCEVSLPMRSHWFFVEDDKYDIKTKDKLLNLYFRTVGNNSCLMLGLSPNKRGVLDDTDRQILTSLGCDINLLFGYNLLMKAKSLEVSSVYQSGFESKNLISKDMNSFWRPSDKDKKPEVVFEIEDGEYFDKIVISENIEDGQHVEEFEIHFFDKKKKKWKKVYTGNTIGYKKICDIKPEDVSKIKIIFTQYRGFIEISNIAIN